MAQRVRMTRAEFLAWDEAQDRRFEYDGYDPVGVTGGTVGRDVIRGNVYALRWSALRGKPCRPYGSDLRVLAGQAMRYPDVLVSCTPMRRMAATVFADRQAGWAGVLVEGTLVEGTPARLDLPEIGVSLALADLYHGVTLGPPLPISE